MSGKPIVRRGVPKLPVNKDEILLPCTICNHVISHENYEKHIAVHKLEQVASIKQGRNMQENPDESETACFIMDDTIVCPVCRESILANVFRTHLTDHINVHPTETVIIKEEPLWDQIGEEDNDPMSVENELQSDVDCSKKRKISDHEDNTSVFREDMLPEIISSENYKKHIDDHKLEEAASANQGRNVLENSDESETVTALANVFGTHSTDYINELPTETVIIKEEPLWDQMAEEDNENMSNKEDDASILQDDMLSKVTERDDVGDTAQRNIQLRLVKEEDEIIPLAIAETILPVETESENATLSGVGDHILTHETESLSESHTSGLDNCIPNSAFRKKVLRNLISTNLSDMKPFTCSHCDQRFALYSELQDHQKQINDRKRFRCTICFRTFYQCYHLRTHHTSHHKNLPFVVGDAMVKAPVLISNNSNRGDKPCKNSFLPGQLFPCVYCEVIFNQFKELADHLQTHNNETLLKCSNCHKSVSMENVATKRKGVVVCLSCASRIHLAKEEDEIIPLAVAETVIPVENESEYATLSGVENHILTHETESLSENNTSSLDNCIPNSAFRKKVLRNLISTNLGDMKPFSCFHCDQRFALYSELQDHQKQINDRKRFRCTICFRTFYQCYHLKTHHTSHHKNLPFVVGDAMVKAPVLISNNSNRGDKPCKNSFLPGQLFPCVYCEVIFNQFKELADHLQTHKNETLLKCSNCHKSVTVENVATKRKGVVVCLSCSSMILEMGSIPIETSLNEHLLNIKNEDPGKQKVVPLNDEGPKRESKKPVESGRDPLSLNASKTEPLLKRQNTICANVRDSIPKKRKSSTNPEVDRSAVSSRRLRPR